MSPLTNSLANDLTLIDWSFIDEVFDSRFFSSQLILNDA